MSVDVSYALVATRQWTLFVAQNDAEPTGSTVSFTYNAAGQRVAKDAGGATGFLYDLHRLLHETDDVGEITQTYTTSTDEEFGGQSKGGQSKGDTHLFSEGQIKGGANQRGHSVPALVVATRSEDMSAKRC